jgi:chemotaxis signal transduction protein
MSHAESIGKLIAYRITSNDRGLSLSPDVAAVIKLPPEGSLIPMPGSMSWVMGCLKYSGSIVPIINWGYYRGDLNATPDEVLVVNDREGGYVGLAIKEVEGLISADSLSNTESEASVDKESSLGVVMFENEKWTVISLMSALKQLATRI